MVIKNLENKIKLVMIICSLFLVGCIIICISSIWTAKQMVSDAHQKVYVLDGNVPILVQRSTMEETLDVEAKKISKYRSYLQFLCSLKLFFQANYWDKGYTLLINISLHIYQNLCTRSVTVIQYKLSLL